MELRRIKRGRSSADESFSETLSFILPRPGFYITPILIGLNTVVFIIMVCAGLGVISFQASDLLNWGANYGPSVRHGQWFRLVSSLFVHGGLVHLFTNLSGLFFVGFFLERSLGRTRFVIAYFVTGIVAGITSISLHPQIVSVGASGAIFGLYGILLVLLLVKDIGTRSFKDRLLVGVIALIIVNLVIGSVTPGIDNAAHLGGLFSGMLLGALLSLTTHLDQLS